MKKDLDSTHVFQNGTGQQIIKSLDGVAKNLSTMAIAKSSQVDITNYRHIQRIVQLGLAKEYFQIGDQIHTIWQATGEESVDLPWDIVDFGPATDPDGIVHENAMWLQSHYGTANMPFGSLQAFYRVPEEMPAGTYRFTSGTSYSSAAFPAGVSYSFTISNNVPAGGYLVFGTATSDSAPNKAGKIRVYGNQLQEQPTEIVDIALSDDGVDLGEFGKCIPGEYGFNNMGSCYGTPNWKKSIIRQWLNSDKQTGEWWKPQNQFERLYSISQSGFMTQISQEFLAIVKPIKLSSMHMSPNNGLEYETVTDRFFVASSNQEYNKLAPDINEGKPFEYWINKLGERHANGSKNAKIEHTRFAAYATNTKVSVYTRTSVPADGEGYMNMAISISNSGIVSSSNTFVKRYVVPCCVIY